MGAVVIQTGSPRANKPRPADWPPPGCLTAQEQGGEGRSDLQTSKNPLVKPTGWERQGMYAKKWVELNVCCLFISVGSPPPCRS